MAALPDSSDLARLAKKLIVEGPQKHERTPRRVRGLLGGHYAFDTIEAHHVWEHPYFPQFYIPATSITSDAKLTKDSKAVDGTSGSAFLANLSVGDKSTDRVIMFEDGPLKGLVKIDFPAMDQWFEEETPIYQHPKDPYKRIDILPSHRSIRIALDNTTIAYSTASLFLFETMLRPRYYLPPTSINWTLLSKSDTETYCPYKGRANYYNVTVGGKEYKDIVWWYQYPTVESAAIAGALCFYNEKVDVWVDGVKEER
ncbi:DUF427-domain-containing protein [Lepidopterella palustris CBS 459.81]|uniref:DUF427-domain-containing protein n=1 Tax=Lepidopterella palustris CBS 459.81 TaxID=1314670 RepID=A0A8E2JKF1_9PEZI|nr:DUF427-domain-containing protein [Lepidopterella palustris CBS 459.81]